MRGARLSKLGLAFVTILQSCAGGPTSQPLSISPAAVLSCSLPVVSWLKNGGNAASQNGFIAVPSGAITVDITPNGYTYDRAYRRWLPVLASMVLPDGSAYAYEDQPPDGEYDIHVVQVASGADKVISRMPYDNAYSVLALQPEGVYVV